MSKPKNQNRTAPRFPGIAIVLGGDEYIVPPLALGRLEAMLPRLQKFSGGLDKDSTNTALDAAHAALARNYPEITREELGELVDVANMQEIMEAVMDVSGLHRKRIEDEKNGALEVAGDNAAPLTSTSSTATSAPAMDGPGSTSEST